MKFVLVFVPSFAPMILMGIALAVDMRRLGMRLGR